MTDGAGGTAESSTGNRRARDLLGVWPTELRKEWRQRTRYGKARYLLLLPMYLAAWAVMLLLAIIMAAAYYALVLLWRAYLTALRVWPDTHRDRGECNGE